MIFKIEVGSHLSNECIVIWAEKFKVDKNELIYKQTKQVDNKHLIVIHDKVSIKNIVRISVEKYLTSSTNETTDNQTDKEVTKIVCGSTYGVMKKRKKRKK